MAYRASIRRGTDDMEQAGAKHIIRAAIVGLALIGASACSEKTPSGKADTAPPTAAGAPATAAAFAPNPNRQYPPSTAFDQFLRIVAGRFHSTEQFTVFDAANSGGAVDHIQYNYVYTDDRFAAIHNYNTDVSLSISKFPTAEMARASVDRYLAGAIPIARADSVRLPACRGEKSGSDDFVGPEKIVRTVPNPRGGVITILHSGDFNMYDCTRGSNRTETAVWTDGEYVFTASALPMVRPADDTGYGRAEELAIDYTTALGPR